VSETTTPGDEPPDDDDFPRPELEDYGKARYDEEKGGPKAVVREARRILREVVRSERRAELEAKPKPKKWERRKADRDKR
jgi:hypothetical protein